MTTRKEINAAYERAKAASGLTDEQVIMQMMLLKVSQQMTPPSYPDSATQLEKIKHCVKYVHIMGKLNRQSQAACNQIAAKLRALSDAELLHVGELV